jgi:sugar phosphate permease
MKLRKKRLLFLILDGLCILAGGSIALMGIACFVGNPSGTTEEQASWGAIFLAAGAVAVVIGICLGRLGSRKTHNQNLEHISDSANAV